MTTQAWQCHTLDGPDALRWETLPTPQPGPGEVRIAVRCASLNFPDLLVVQGKYQFKPPLPFAPGAEFSGIVEAVGDGVTHLSAGDAVAAIGSHGGFATHACVRADHVIPLPPGMRFEDGAAFAFTYGTVQHGLMDRGALRAGETVLVLGASGGVGSAAVQVAKRAGARVLATASTPAKAAFCKSLGADEVIDLSQTALRDGLKASTDGRGVDVVLDPVGGDLAEPAFRAMAWRGRYLVVGFAAGGIPALPWNLPLLKGASIIGVFWGEFVRRERKAFAADLQSLAAGYADGALRPAIDSVLPMQELPAAFNRLSSREVMGKLVLRNETPA
jgi:NADPH2:quinone reductase